MSLFSKIGNIAKTVLQSPVAKVAAGVIGGPVGTTLMTAATAYGAYQSLKAPSVGSVSPGAGSVMALPQLGSSFAPMGMLSPGTIAGAGRAVVAGGRAVARGAVSLCRKYPQWCSTIGGTVAVEALMHSGQIPVPRRRRGRGISAHELKAFKRVARFTSKYCAPVHRAMKAPAVRKGASCR